VDFRAALTGSQPQGTTTQGAFLFGGKMLPAEDLVLMKKLEAVAKEHGYYMGGVKSKYEPENKYIFYSFKTYFGKYVMKDGASEGTQS
jgi:hypothetical protein